MLNLICVLFCFQVVSGLNINLMKSEMVRLGNLSDTGRLALILGYKVVDLQINY